MIDVILISHGATKELQTITQNAVDTCGKHNIIVVETHSKIKYKNCNTVYNIQTPKEFNYNKTLNEAFKLTRSEYVFFGNNDLQFTEGWAEECIKQMKKYNAFSSSPFCPISFPATTEDTIEGYKVRGQIAGWALMLNRKVFDYIGKFDERVKFWRSDNLYADQIKREGLKHILCCKSIVYHLENGSNTLDNLDENIKKQLTHGQYDREVNDYKFSVIIPSYLGEYLGAAKNREDKLRRALNSLLKQTFKDFEVIIVSDDCDKTVEIYREYEEYDNIICAKIEKQPVFSGLVRDVGLQLAKGEYIIYLDSDDFYGKDHLSNVNKQVNGLDWCYFDDILNSPREAIIKEVKLVYGLAGTSSICHKRSLKASWKGCNGYGHDWKFIEKLLKYPKFKKIQGAEYFICHTPGSFDV